MKPDTRPSLKPEPCAARQPETCPSLKRGWPAQQARREAEREARIHAVDFGNWAIDLGFVRNEAAEQLGLAPGTIACWRHRWHVDYLEARPLGRRCHRSEVPYRNQAIDFMRHVGPGVSAAAVEAHFPELARREAENLRDRFRHVWRLDHAREALGPGQ
jgi:hypothetical protein